MKDFVNTLVSRRLPVTFFILLGLSILVGVMIGHKSPFGIGLIFYMIVILNTLSLIHI